MEGSGGKKEGRNTEEKREERKKKIRELRK
jgi:hypothetical protein